MGGYGFGEREGVAREPVGVRLHVGRPGGDVAGEGARIMGEQRTRGILEAGEATRDGAHEAVGALGGLALRVAPGVRATRLVHQPAQRGGGTAGLAFDQFEAHLRIPRDSIALESREDLMVREVAHTSTGVLPIIHLPSIMEAIQTKIPNGNSLQETQL